MKKRIIAMILCFVMLMAAAPVTVSAQTAQSIEIADFGTKTYGDDAFKVSVTADVVSKLTDFTYESSNPAVAEIGADGTVTIKAAGETVITVKQAGNANFAAAETSKTLTVNKKDVMLSSLDVDNREAELMGILEEDADKVALDFDKLNLELADGMTSDDVEDILVQQGCVKIRGVVTENAYTSLWSDKVIDTTATEYVEIEVFDAFDTTNKDFADGDGDLRSDCPSAYLVGSSNAADFIGKSVIAYVREIGSNWEIVSIEADPDRNSVLKITPDQFNTISYNKFEYYASATAKTATSVSLDDDVAFVYNNVGGWDSDDIFGYIIAENGATLESGQITLIDNNDTKGYDVIFVDLAETAVVDYAEEGYAAFKSGTVNNDIYELEYDESDTDKLVKIVKDGKEIALEDLKEWDVLSIYAAYDDSGYIVAEVNNTSVVGIITSESNSITSATGKSYKIGDVKYDAAVGAYGVDGVAIGDGGVFYIDKYGKIAAFKEDYELATGVKTNYAYVTAVADDEDILTGKKTAIFQLVTADGVVALNLKSKGAKLNGASVNVDDDMAALEALAGKIIKYSKNSSNNITNITTLDADDNITGGMYSALVAAEYNAKNNRFIGKFYMDVDSYVFFIDPHDFEDSYIGTVADLTDGEVYEIMGRYADKNAEDYNIIIISADVERPEEPEVETDMGYAYVTAVAFDEDILTGKNTAMIQLVTTEGLKVLNLRAKSANINGMTVNADDNAPTIESISKNVIKYSVIESGEISTILTADCDESITGGMFAENYVYDEANLRFGDDGGFEVATDAQVIFVDPYSAEDSFIGTVSNLVDGENYDIIGKYCEDETEIYSIIVIFADVELPEVPETETDAGYAYVTAVAFDEDILTGKNTAMFQLVTTDGLKVLNLKEKGAKLNGVTVNADDDRAEIEDLQGRIIRYSVNNSDNISSIVTADSDEALTGGMYAEAVVEEFDLEKGAFGDRFTVDADAKVFFIDENSAEDSYMGTVSDLIDGVGYDVMGQYAEGESSSIVVVKRVDGIVSKKAGFSVITEVGTCENADGDMILSIETLLDGETIVADTTADVFNEVEGMLTAGDIVKLNINKNGVIDGLTIVYDFNEEIRAKYDEDACLEDYDLRFEMMYDASDDENIVGGVVANYRKSATTATIRGTDYKLSQADNVYVIDANGRKLDVKKGATSSFKYYEALYTDGVSRVNVTIGDVEYRRVNVNEAMMVADYVFVREYDGKVTDVVIVKGPEDTKIRAAEYYSLSLLSTEEENGLSLFASSGTVVARVTNLTLTGEKAENYNLTTDELYSIINEENIVNLTIMSENGTVVGGDTGKYLIDSVVTLTAVPNIGYNFKGWYKDDRCVCATESYELVLMSDIEVTVVFEHIEGLNDCGIDANGINWYLYESGVLELNGEGAMADYSGTSMIPWYSDRGMVTEIDIADGITHIGDRSFYNCVSAKKVTIPASVTSIGTYAFNNCDEMTIYGVAGSYAETYAKENGIPFAEYVASVKLNEITVDMTENTSKWYFDVSLAGIEETVNVHIAIYDEDGRMLNIVSDVLATDDVTTLSISKRNDASHAKVHILDETGMFAAISKRIDF